MTRLEQLRVDSGMTREKLSELSGVTARTIHRLENGQTASKVGTLGALARVLNARPSELLQEALPPTERAA